MFYKKHVGSLMELDHDQIKPTLTYIHIPTMSF